MSGQLVVLTGMVIHVMPVGDYDKRLLILTTDRGKITVFAKGARRPNSPYIAAANPFVFGEFELFEGRSAYNLAKANVRNYFRELTIDPQTACYGFYFLEAAEYFARDNNEDKELLKLLYQSLRALEHNKIENYLIRRVFELKLLVLEGEYPNVFSCQKCGSKEHLHRFSVQSGGLICDSCAQQERLLPVSESMLYALQFIVTAPVEKLYTFTLSRDTFREFEVIMEKYLAVYLPHKFKSLEILQSILS